MSHTAEIIAVGTELLLGNITNTNASEISRALSAVGVNVFWHTVVGDNPERLREALDIARKRADVILTTGALAPPMTILPSRPSARPSASRWSCGRMYWSIFGLILPGTST